MREAETYYSHQATGTWQPTNRADRSHVASRESRRRSDTPSTTLCNKGGKRSRSRGSVHSELALRNTQSPPQEVATTPARERGTRQQQGASGVNRHSDKHAPRHIPEAQDAFKVLMIHWILQVARRIAFRCVLHRCGSQDIRR